MTTNISIRPHPGTERLWRTHLLASQGLTDIVQRELQQHVNMLLIHYEILEHLIDVPERSLRMSELADSAQSSRSRLSHAISRLEEIGYVERKECPIDRRGSYAVLTEAGEQAYNAARPHVERSLERHLYDVLDDTEQQQLLELYTKLLSHLAGTDALPSSCTSGLLDTHQ
ncbi:MAG: MarR family winged helix-turn-helix transcriptional regulator [Candidatus Dormibacteria bacterium]